MYSMYSDTLTTFVGVHEMHQGVDCCSLGVHENVHWDAMTVIQAS